MESQFFGSSVALTCSGAGGHLVRPNDGSKTRLARQFRGPDVTWSDGRLIRACLRGNEQAWSALINKYKNLVYSIPVRYGASPEDAADIFQSVCLELFSELPRLRKTAAFRSWLITVTAHQSFHWKRKVRRRAEAELTTQEEDKLGVDPSPDLIEQVEREQMLREAVAQLPARCQEIIMLLFYQQPPMAYRDVAQRLGLATGSMGFIRGRCLKRLQRTLEEWGF
jgi:RNA polymerase sigma factor (sigma-70 family)